MASFDIAFKQRVSNVAVVQTFVNTEVQVGDTVVVAGVGSSFDGTVTVISTQPFLLVDVDSDGNLWFDYDETYVNQVIYKNTGDDVSRTASAVGTLTWSQVCTWIKTGDVLDWLGLDPANQNDVEYLTDCVTAANAYCHRKRREAGYSDSLSTVPGGDVKLGTVLYAASLYRERGAVDSFASFDTFGTTGAPTMSMGRIMQLLGCGRPQVG